MLRWMAGATSVMRLVICQETDEDERRLYLCQGRKASGSGFEVPMMRLSVVLGLVCVAGLGCRGQAPGAAAMPQPPPPLIEPELAPGSRLDNRDHDQRGGQLKEGLIMKSIAIGLALSALALVAGPVTQAQSPDLQQKLAASKEAAARNQQALRWVLVAREDRIEPEGRSEEHQG